MAFRFKKSVPVDYDQQGYIYFVSRRYRRLSGQMQDKILNLCLEAGGEYYQALFEFLTSNAGAVAVCAKYFLSQSTLERAVKRYYVLFSESLRNENQMEDV